MVRVKTDSPVWTGDKGLKRRRNTLNDDCVSVPMHSNINCAAEPTILRVAQQSMKKTCGRHCHHKRMHAIRSSYKIQSVSLSQSCQTKCDLLGAYARLSMKTPPGPRANSLPVDELLVFVTSASDTDTPPNADTFIASASTISSCRVRRTTPEQDAHRVSSARRHE
jgi:hypothetical protein